MRVFNAKRLAAIEVLTGEDSACLGFVILRDPDRMTAGEVLCSNSKELPAGWWLLHYFHKCRSNLMEEWFRGVDDVPNETGNYLICQSCGTIGLEVGDCP